MRRFMEPSSVLFTAAICLLAWLPALPSNAASREQIQKRALQIFGVLPEEAKSAANPITREKVTLGRMLYYEKRLSKSHRFSCDSCHPLAAYGVDGDKTSLGHGGHRGVRNAPTVYNAAIEFAQFWDGRAADVEEQALGPILNPVEMGMPSSHDVVAVLKSIPGYGPLFQAAFPGEKDPINYANVGKAIGAFERELMTPGRFDLFLQGNLQALNNQEVRGLETFVDTGCTTCHMGPGVGGTMFQKVGLVHPYPGRDLGRYDVTKKNADKYVFKVPSLRNVAMTPPYFSQGEVPTLHKAVELMAYHQLGKKLTEEQKGQIIAFLHSLTGAIPDRLIAPPELPASGPHTPGPSED